MKELTGKCYVPFVAAYYAECRDGKWRTWCRTIPDVSGYWNYRVVQNQRENPPDKPADEPAQESTTSCQSED